MVLKQRRGIIILSATMIKIEPNFKQMVGFPVTMRIPVTMAEPMIARMLMVHQ